MPSPSDSALPLRRGGGLCRHLWGLCNPGGVEERVTFPVWRESCAHFFMWVLLSGFLFSFKKVGTVVIPVALPEAASSPSRKWTRLCGQGSGAFCPFFVVLVSKKVRKKQVHASHTCSEMLGPPGALRLLVVISEGSHVPRGQGFALEAWMSTPMQTIPPSWFSVMFHA